MLFPLCQQWNATIYYSVFVSQSLVVSSLGKQVLNSCLFLNIEYNRPPDLGLISCPITSISHGFKKSCEFTNFPLCRCYHKDGSMFFPASCILSRSQTYLSTLIKRVFSSPSHRTVSWGGRWGSGFIQQIHSHTSKFSESLIAFSVICHGSFSIFTSCNIDFFFLQASKIQLRRLSSLSLEVLPGC